MYSKVTLACALKGDGNSRLKQLLKCKEILRFFLI